MRPSLSKTASVRAHFGGDVANFGPQFLADLRRRQIKDLSVALAGELQQPFVAFPIIGIGRIGQPITGHRAQFIQQPQYIHVCPLPSHQSPSPYHNLFELHLIAAGFTWPLGHR